MPDELQERLPPSEVEQTGFDPSNTGGGPNSRDCSTGCEGPPIAGAQSARPFPWAARSACLGDAACGEKKP